jgi:hypothetical protein
MIDQTSVGQAAVHFARKAQADKLVQEQSAQVVKDQAAGPASIVPGPTAVPDQNSDALDGNNGAATEQAKVPGVLRLLESGHFKGVADVRLRINFFDQLSATATAAGQAAAQASADQLTQTVSERFDELLAAFAPDEQTTAAAAELRAGFDAAVQAAADTFATAAQPDLTAFNATVQSAFDAFFTQLSDLLLPTPDADPDESDAIAGAVDAIPSDADEIIGDAGAIAADLGEVAASTEFVVENESADAVPPLLEPGEVVAEPVEQGSADVDAADARADLLASFASAFADALSQFADSLTGAMQLPDPSAPSGNGKAYDKFLAIYNALRGVPENMDTVG